MCQDLRRQVCIAVAMIICVRDIQLRYLIVRAKAEALNSACIPGKDAILVSSQEPLSTSFSTTLSFCSSNMSSLDFVGFRSFKDEVEALKGSFFLGYDCILLDLQGARSTFFSTTLSFCSAFSSTTFSVCLTFFSATLSFCSSNVSSPDFVVFRSLTTGFRT